MSHTALPDDDCLLARVAGGIPETKPAVLTYEDSLLSSVHSDVIRRESVLFLGTADGRLKKVIDVVAPFCQRSEADHLHTCYCLVF